LIQTKEAPPILPVTEKKKTDTQDVSGGKKKTGDPQRGKQTHPPCHSRKKKEELSPYKVPERGRGVLRLNPPTKKEEFSSGRRNILLPRKRDHPGILFPRRGRVIPEPFTK